MDKLQFHRKIPGVRGIYGRLGQATRERDGLATQLEEARRERDRLATQLEEARLGRDASAAQLGRVSAGLEQAIRERDEIAAETRSLAREVDDTKRDRERVVAHRDRLITALNRPALTDPDNASLPSTPTVETQSVNAFFDDAKIVERIIAAYKLALSAAGPASSSIWEQSFFHLKRDIHEALVQSDPVAVRDLLRDPRKSDLLHGFENLARSLRSHGPGLLAYLDLLLLSIAIGAHRLWNPEYLAVRPGYVEVFPDTEALLKSIDKHIGFRVTFPNPFAGEVGLPTPRGVASFRAIQSLYQAWLVASLVGEAGSVVEIGAGTGRTAYYAHQIGITNYTIVDLPMTNVAQANFLSRTLGEEAIKLFGETNLPSKIRILPPEAFFDSADEYDLAVNVDSLTEMTIESARSYCLEIKSRAQKFLSINHEYNDFTVRDLCSQAAFPNGTRHPYWMRRGYVEELFEF